MSDSADYGLPNDRGHDPTETTCRACGRLAIDHLPGMYSIYGVCPGDTR